MITGARTWPRLCGVDLEVPLADGTTRRYVNLDCAASTPALDAVVSAVNQALPWYSSVHRGAGHLSQVSTRLYESARQAVGDFVGARPDDSVVFVRNTTDAINHLAACLRVPSGSTVLTTEIEHHANMLPWRRLGSVEHLPPPRSAAALLESMDAALRAAAGRVAVVAVTGASNVTGEVMPVGAMAQLAHRHGAIISVDAAQLAPHRTIDMATMDVDCLAFSGHKMYAPFGAGALVVRTALVADAEPLLAGGGAVDFVTVDDVLWTGMPDRLEAGSPNVIGAIALGVAATTLSAAGMERIAGHERELLARADRGLAGLRGVNRLRLWDHPDVDRLGVVTFTVDGMHHALVAAALSAEHAIGVRHGCFCAHPYITQLLGIDAVAADSVRISLRRGERAGIPGAVRASFSIGTTEHDIDVLIGALDELITHGPRLAYRQDEHTGDFLPLGDARTWPRFDGLPPLETAGHTAGCGQF
ncbi:MAG: aminotransferase class V-fold PLP-dependent enzyme [Candidatus Dormibacteraeota bacterium]|uniref:Aminotransferase class V-fold PLP-dependent enzyme n=1 Tax=Candidatus Amunia macphersoniae TaxID=3127014 RepID=A0A934NGF4_9BACT|nr:aminotransferase class V-fold PLP-dependent enzyme [Candidatus Dormibacteraeota bacterium]